MVTIEERLYKYTPLEDGDMVQFTHEQSAKINEWIDKAYLDGSKEQHKIDIEKACEWLNSLSDTFEDEYVSLCGELTNSFFEDFRKAMES